MHATLILHSNSTKKYAEELAKEYADVEIININSLSDVRKWNILYERVIGIGGGKVIDIAKLIANPNSAIAIPTTAAGAASTSHAVYWDKITKKKISIPTRKPIVEIEPSFLSNLPKEVIIETFYDALGHAMDSYLSVKATKESIRFSVTAYNILMKQRSLDFNNISELIEAGNIAGEAIEITETNMSHAISYPLTAVYGISHGIAVGWSLYPCYIYQECPLDIPDFDISLGIEMNRDFFETVAHEAMTYSKIHNARKNITEERLIDLLETYKK